MWIAFVFYLILFHIGYAFFAQVALALLRSPFTIIFTGLFGDDARRMAQLKGRTNARAEDVEAATKQRAPVLYVIAYGSLMLARLALLGFFSYIVGQCVLLSIELRDIQWTWIWYLTGAAFCVPAGLAYARKEQRKMGTGSAVWLLCTALYIATLIEAPTFLMPQLVEAVPYLLPYVD